MKDQPIISNGIWSAGVWKPDDMNTTTNTTTPTTKILGQYMGVDIKVTYDAVVDHFYELALQRPAKFGKCISTMRDIMFFPGSHELSSTLLGNFSNILDAELEKSGVKFPVDAKLLMHSLPCDIECHPDLEIYTIDSSDPRQALVGENGVRLRNASSPIRRGTFLGLYRGEVMLHSAFKKWKLTPPAGVHPIAHEMLIDSYAAVTTLYNIGEWARQYNVTFPHMSHTRAHDNSLVVSAARHGNIMCVINDPHICPMEDDMRNLGENVDLFEVVIGPWPFFCMFATRDIQPNEDLKYSYGTAFWDYFQEHTLRARSWNGFSK